MPKKKPSETKPTTQEQKGNASKQTATAEQVSFVKSASCVGEEGKRT